MPKRSLETGRSVDIGLPPIRDAVKPPTAVARNAALGLELRRKLRRGGTRTGLDRARSLMEREPQDEADLRQMQRFFARQEAAGREPEAADNLQAEPSDAAVAWLLWGGDEGRAWVEKNCAALRGERATY